MKSVHSDLVPKAIGPYSQAVIAGDLIFCSGQIALDPVKGELVAGGAKEQTVQVLKNLKEVLKAASVGFEAVASVTVYLRDMKDFNDVNEIYGSVFNTDPLPARVTVAVSGLPKNALVEITCIASR
ncbi:MAG: Rid family detoxifying hydrolase [bacterium]|nr:Rid family detoxifying hydrolase [bacterium]